MSTDARNPDLDQAPGTSTDKESTDPLGPRSEWLWEAGRRLDDGPAGPANEISDQELVAYREARLAAADRERVEAALLASSSLRDRFARVAQGPRAAHPPSPVEGPGALLSPAAPPPGIRSSVLGAFETAFDQGTGQTLETAASDSPGPAPVIGGPGRFGDRARESRFPSSRVLGPLAALAAALVLAVLFPFWRADLEPLPGDAEWHLTAEGAARVRGIEEGLLELGPDTRLRLEASPTRAIDGVDFALFHDDGEQIERLALEPSMVQVERGAIRIEAVTRELLGQPAERGRLILAVARAGGLPSARDLGTGPAPDADEPSRAYRLYEVEYRAAR